jgi:glycosyltransferase involved in cell wall biosynthesis
MPADNNSICFVIPKFVTFSTGGAELQVHLLSQQFLKNGWNVEVICRGAGHEQTIAKSPHFDSRIKYSYYKRTSFFCTDFFKVFRLLMKSRSKWIYNRTDDAATAAVAAFAKLTGRKSVYALASDDDASPAKYLPEYKKIKYGNAIKRLIRLTDISILDMMVRWGKKHVSVVICQTYPQQKLFESNFGRQSYVVSNSAVAATGDISQKENIVLWVGNFRAVKQPNLFMELASGFANHPQWQFVMIGEADNASLPLIEKMKKQQNFFFKGSLDYEETTLWFRKAKIYVNTSSIEGFPNTFIQSWLNHCQIVSLNANPDHLLDDKEMGLVFNGNMDQMKNHISDIIHNRITSNGASSKAFSYAVERFDIAANTAKITEILAQNS